MILICHLTKVSIAKFNFTCNKNGVENPNFSDELHMLVFDAGGNVQEGTDCLRSEYSSSDSPERKYIILAQEENSNSAQQQIGRTRGKN